MMNEVVKVHDKFSVEIKRGHKTRKDLKNNDFSISTWFFIPSSLDINRSTYKKDDFYNDFKSNIRLITPVYLLREMAVGEQSVFGRLEDAFSRVSIHPSTKNEAHYEYHIRMFHSILKTALRNEIDHIKMNTLEEDRQYLINEFISNIGFITSRYRELRRVVNAPTIRKEMFDYYLFGDEFMSNLIEQHSYYLLSGLKKLFPEDYRSNKPAILGLVAKEVEYKKSMGYLVAERKSQDNNRELIYKRGVLKKYFEGQLFLSTRTKKEGILAEQLLFSLAAGVAMIFGGTMTLVFKKSLGEFTIPLFFALVVSYMLKDRLKDLTRHYLVGKISKRFFDHKTTIKVKKDEKIGWCKESFDFVREDSLPKRVKRYRNRSQIVEVENRGAGEKIILYRKLLRLDQKALDNVYGSYNITGVTDIIRFNVSRFIQKMDNPEIPLYILKDDSYEKISGEKVYFINMIIRYEVAEESKYSRYRIIFNRRGIKKVVKL